MFDDLDPRSPTPLYDQIAARIKIAVAAGELRPGTGLPSVRQLAARLRINPATVVQAYRSLEADGFVELRQGAGTFVREVAPDMKKRERAHGAAKLVRQMLAEAGRLGIEPAALRAALDKELGVEVT